VSQLVLYLMNKKGLCVLERLLETVSAEKIAYVVLSKDENVRKDYQFEIQDLCEQKRIRTFDRKDALPAFSGYKFAVGWRWMIEDTENLIIFHDSILPRYRGFSPLVNMLINGEKEIGVTALFATDHYDRGDIIQIKKESVDYPLKIEEAIYRVGRMCGELIVGLSEKILNGQSISAVPQNEQEVSYSVWRDSDDYVIDWNQSASLIQRTVDALGFPYAGARTTVNQEWIVLEDVEEVFDYKIENRDVGKVLFAEDGHPVVICGQGLLKLKAARNEAGNSVLPMKKFRSRFGG